MRKKFPPVEKISYQCMSSPRGKPCQHGGLMVFICRRLPANESASGRLCDLCASSERNERVVKAKSFLRGHNRINESTSLRPKVGASQVDML